MEKVKEITDLYVKRQDKLFEYVNGYIERNCGETFKIAVINGRGGYIVLAPKNYEGKYFPVIVSHLDSYYRNGNPRNDVVPDEVIETEEGYYVGRRNHQNFILGGDDRNGVWTMLKLIEDGVHDVGYIFTKDEESQPDGPSRLGAASIVEQGIFGENGIMPASKISCFIEADRQGCNELAYYQIGNNFSHNNGAFQQKLNELCPGHQFRQGSATDIVNFCTHTFVCGINISCGYFNAHTNGEYTVIGFIMNLPNQIKQLVNALRGEQYLIR